MAETSVPVESPTRGSGNIPVVKLQDKGSVAIVQNSETKEIRVMTRKEQEQYFTDPELRVLPKTFQVTSTVWGKLLKPDNIAKQAKIPTELQDVVNEALYRHGVLKIDSEYPISEQAMDSASRAVHRVIMDSLRSLNG